MKSLIPFSACCLFFTWNMSPAAIVFSDDFTAYGVSSTDVNLNLPATDGMPHPALKVRQTGSVGSYRYFKQGGDNNSQIGNPSTSAGQAGAPAYADYLLLAYAGQVSSRLPVNEALAQGQPLSISFDLGTALPPGASDTSWWAAFRLGPLGTTYPVVGNEADFAFLYRINKGLQVFAAGMAAIEYPDVTDKRFTLVLTDSEGTGSAFSGQGSKVALYNGSVLIGKYETGQLTQEFMNFSVQNAFASVDNLVVESGLPAFLENKFRITNSAFDFNAGKLDLSWTSEAGAIYQVAASDTLQGGWMPIGTTVTAAGGEASATVDLADKEKEFFRVETVPVFVIGEPDQQVKHDPAAKTVTLYDASGNLGLRLNYAGRCLIDHMQVNGKEVIASSTGVCTAIQVGGVWSTTRTLEKNPQVRIQGNDVTVSGIEFAAGGVSVRETWTFQVGAGDIQWKISRQYLTGGVIQDSYFPGWEFTSVNTWTGGLLDHGGVAWTRYLGSGASYGTHSGSANFWKNDSSFKVTVESQGGADLASRFSHQPSGIFSFVQSATPAPLKTKHSLHRSVGGMDVWAPYTVQPGTVETKLKLSASSSGNDRYRGEFKGIDGKAVGDLLDTIGRYGVVDREIVGGNGWLTGWVCLHEPFFAQMGLALGDVNFTANLATSLDAWRDHALQPSGRVYSRWHHDTGDNMVPGTYDPETGYYECGWGYLLDSQSDYAINVAEQFDLTGDLNWLQGQKEPCERAIDWLLARDSDGDGLVEMMTESHTQGKASDWLDVVWASWENAFVNAKFYQALVLWTEREEILGDTVKAAKYRAAAAKLKASFIRPTTEGGFWDANNGWFIYWRDKDNSIHGNNLVTAVNFAATAYGLCTPEQKQTLLTGIETRMRQENLFHWPSCFLSYAPGEGRDNNFPTYENGDIFLSWGELAVRSYAKHDPSIAVAYVNRVLDRYRQDGLSYQRYSRANQAGAGDDILAGNSMTIVGLYRNIYGVRPQWNRMMLDPHVTPALAGTTLRYPLRGKIYQLTPGVETSSVEVDQFSAKAATPFAVDAKPTTVSWFSGEQNKPSLVISRSASENIGLQVTRWETGESGTCQWTVTRPVAQAPVTTSIHGLPSGASYSLTVNGTPSGSRTADASGSLSLSLPPASATQEFVLTLP